MSVEGRGSGKVEGAEGAPKGNTGDGGARDGVLDVGSGDVWSRPEEVSYAAPSCKAATQARGSLRKG